MVTSYENVEVVGDEETSQGSKMEDCSWECCVVKRNVADPVTSSYLEETSSGVEVE